MCGQGGAGLVVVQGAVETKKLLKEMGGKIVLDLTAALRVHFESTHGDDLYIRPFSGEPAGVLVALDEILIIVLPQLSIGSALSSPHALSNPNLLAHNSAAVHCTAEAFKALLRPDEPSLLYKDSTFAELGGPEGGQAFMEKARQLGCNYKPPSVIGGPARTASLAAGVFRCDCKLVREDRSRGRGCAWVSRVCVRSMVCT